MPPQNINELSKLYIEQPDGSRMIIGKVQTADIISEDCNDILGMETVTFPTQTATFEVTWSPTVDLVYLLIHGRIPTNNWRRIHGFGTKRRVRK